MRRSCPAWLGREGAARSPEPRRRTRPGALGLCLLALGLGGCAPAKPVARPPAAKRYEAPEERYVFFANGRSDVLADGFFAIGYVASQLDADPKMHVLIVGHADVHGKTDYNRDLSLKRARAVRKVLLDHGVKEKHVLVASPKDTNESMMVALSRRVDLFVYDPLLDEASTRLGYPVEVKDE